MTCVKLVNHLDGCNWTKFLSRRLTMWNDCTWHTKMSHTRALFLEICDSNAHSHQSHYRISPNEHVSDWSNTAITRQWIMFFLSLVVQGYEILATPLTVQCRSPISVYILLLQQGFSRFSSALCEFWFNLRRSWVLTCTTDTRLTSRLDVYHRWRLKFTDLEVKDVVTGSNDKSKRHIVWWTKFLVCHGTYQLPCCSHKLVPNGWASSPNGKWLSNHRDSSFLLVLFVCACLEDAPRRSANWNLGKCHLWGPSWPPTSDWSKLGKKKQLIQ